MWWQASGVALPAGFGTKRNAKRLAFLGEPGVNVDVQQIFLGVREKIGIVVVVLNAASVGKARVPTALPHSRAAPPTPQPYYPRHHLPQWHKQMVGMVNMRRSHHAPAPATAPGHGARGHRARICVPCKSGAKPTNQPTQLHGRKTTRQQTAIHQRIGTDATRAQRGRGE